MRCISRLYGKRGGSSSPPQNCGQGSPRSCGSRARADPDKRCRAIPWGISSAVADGVRVQDLVAIGTRRKMGVKVTLESSVEVLKWAQNAAKTTSLASSAELYISVCRVSLSRSRCRYSRLCFAGISPRPQSIFCLPRLLSKILKLSCGKTWFFTNVFRVMISFFRAGWRLGSSEPPLRSGVAIRRSRSTVPCPEATSYLRDILSW